MKILPIPNTDLIGGWLHWSLCAAVPQANSYYEDGDMILNHSYSGRAFYPDLKIPFALHHEGCRGAMTDRDCGAYRPRRKESDDVRILQTFRYCPCG